MAFWVTTAVAGLALLLVVINSTLIVTNQSNQAEVNGRQQFINQSIQLSRQSQELVNMLATAAVRNNNTAIRDVLVKNNINLPAASTPAAEPAAPANPPLKKP